MFTNTYFDDILVHAQIFENNLKRTFKICKDT